MSWHTMLRSSWDTETTGTNVETDRIVTAALVVRTPEQADRVFSWVINPGIPCPEEASAVHGWTTERLQSEGQDPEVALEDIAAKLAQVLNARMPLAAFNMAFDWSILHYELLRYGLPTMQERLGVAPQTLIDSHILDRALDKYRKGSRKLKDTATFYGVALDNWHTAEADALAALGVAEQIAEGYPHIAKLEPGDLFERQQRWAADLAADRQRYFRSEKAGDKQDPNAVVDGRWPLQAEVA